MTHDYKQVTLVAISLGMCALIGFLMPSLGVAGAALLIVPALGFFLLQYEVFGLYLLVASLPVENVATIGGAMTATRLLGVVVAGLWIWRKLASRESPAHLLSHRLVKVALVVLLSALATLLWATHVTPAVIGIISLAQLVFLAILVIDLVVTWERASTLVTIVVATGLLGAGLTLKQYYIDGVRRAGDDIAGGVNGTASALVSIMPFAFYLVSSRKHALLRSLGAVYILVGTLAVSVTFSRSSYILLGLLLAIQCWHGLRLRSTRKWFLMILAVAVVAASFAPRRLILSRLDAIGPALRGLTEGVEGKSADSRGFHWAVGLAVFADNPVLGAGYNNYGNEFGRYQFRLDTASRYWVGRRGAHSSYIACLADQGIVGLLLWLSLLGVAGANVLSARRMVAAGNDVGRILLVRAVSYSFAMQIFYGWVLEVRQNKIFWLLLGLSVVVERLTRAAPAREELAAGESAAPRALPRHPEWAT